MICCRIYRLLLQLDETAGNFDTFWTSHRRRLDQCLQLRMFEEQFKQVWIPAAYHYKTICIRLVTV